MDLLKDNTFVANFDCRDPQIQELSQQTAMVASLRGGPSYLSYKSSAGNQVFDTLIFTCPFKPQARHWYIDPNLDKSNTSPAAKRLQKVQRDVAAAKAIQTMRKTGKLPIARFY